MSSSNIFIPKKINVGFQSRTDTYTKKLAYIIYYDNKGILRKENSWNSWRDEKIDNIIFENVPTSGFVLNKKVGDYSSNWNHRQAYVRVYDSRDFEFEITIENLLYILENASSIKGKGLEGDFIYGWDGKDLLLIPVESPDYIEISKFSKMLQTNLHVKAKELILGATYKTKQNEEWIYMGRFDYWNIKYDRVPIESARNFYGYSSQQYKSVYSNVNKGKHHYFARECKNTYSEEIYLSTLKIKSLGDKFIEVISEECVENYAELFDKIECTRDYSPYDESKDVYTPYTFEEYFEKVNRSNGLYCYDSQKKDRHISKVYNKENMYYYEERSNYNSERTEGDIETIYNTIQPMYKDEYLQNGKLYKEGK